MSHNPKKLYGLIIGIDKYPNRDGWWSLHGAVADAKNFRQYLQDLGVPKPNLHLMLNPKRSDIISAFKGLQKGKLRHQEGKLHILWAQKSITIPKGSAFVLFYAGHGGRTDIPESKEWATYRSPDNKVEQLVPSNIDGRKGRIVAGIPDRTTDAVLKKLAETIGDNVTVIFDCCHSAGQIRAQTANNGRPRYLPNLPQLDAKCDWDVIGQGTGDVGLSRKTRGGMTNTRAGEKASNSADRSYVLLAACQQDQFACDDEDGGRFTKYLLKILRDTEPRSLTYASIMLKMQMPDTLQTPACYGANQNRIVFTTIEGKPIDDIFIGEIQPRHEHSADGSNPFIYGGLAHGICTGDKFKLFDTDPEQTPIGEAEVTTSFAACSTISAQFILKSSHLTFYCRLIRGYNTLTVFNDSHDKELLIEIHKQDPSATFAETSLPAEAMVVITDDERRPTQVRLSLQYGSSATYRNHPFLTSIPAGELSKIGKALMATFRLRHILATPKSIPSGWEDIDVSFVEVEKFAQLEGTKQNPDLLSGHWHHRPKMFYHSMNRDGDEVSIIVPRQSDYVLEKDKKFYGLSIKNGSRNFLFVYVLCLDPGLLRIDPWYSSTYFTPVVPFYQQDEESPPQVAAGLKPEETLDIGHGSSGVDPYTFGINDYLAEEYTYFKIILTTSPADFSMLNQTHNPLEPLSTLDPEMVRSNMARGPIRRYDRPRAVMEAQSKQADAKEIMSYFSATLVVHQRPQD